MLCVAPGALPIAPSGSQHQSPEKRQPHREEPQASRLDELGWRRSDQKTGTVDPHDDFPLWCLEVRTIDVAGIANGAISHDGPNVVA
jgi:hypothetical protein